MEANEYEITLQEDAASLDEVIVVGYGTQRKADLTGSIVTIQAEEIEKTPTSNVMQALQGKVAGVQITSIGSPGDSPNVRVRGLGTYTSGTNVLYVVDGALYDNIDFLSTKDIKSINVLKDASSSAIYGVRAANGVIIIETKSGRRNQEPQFEYDGYTGIQRAQDIVQMANAEQFTTMAYESGSQPDIQFVLNSMQRFGRSRINPNVPDVNTDWYDEILRDGLMQSHSIGVSGGGDNVAYSVGTNYLSQEGILDMKTNMNVLIFVQKWMSIFQKDLKPESTLSLVMLLNLPRKMQLGLVLILRFQFFRLWILQIRLPHLYSTQMRNYWDTGALKIRFLLWSLMITE